MKNRIAAIASCRPNIIIGISMITICLADGVLAGEFFELPRGTMSADIGWTTDRITREDVLRGKIEFTPNGEGPSCKSIKMIQIAKVLESPDIFDDYQWDLSSGNYDRNFVRTLHNEESGITGGYFIDYLAVNCKKGEPCSPYYRDHFPNSDESQDGAEENGSIIPAAIVDYPFGWSTIYNISLEVCSVCVSGRIITFLGCAKWGATWPLFSPRYIPPVEASRTPSQTFMRAFDNFNQYYSNDIVVYDSAVASYR
jgi:hypothetical protein